MLILHFISQKNNRMCFCLNRAGLLEPFRLKLCQPEREASEGFVEERRAGGYCALRGPRCRLLSPTAFDPGQTRTYFHTGLGGSQEERALIIRMPKVKPRRVPPMARGGLGTGWQATICCPGGRLAGCGGEGVRALSPSSNAAARPAPATPLGTPPGLARPAVSRDPTGRRTRQGRC